MLKFLVTKGVEDYFKASETTKIVSFDHPTAVEVLATELWYVWLIVLIPV